MPAGSSPSRYPRRAAFSLRRRRLKILALIALGIGAGLIGTYLTFQPLPTVSIGQASASPQAPQQDSQPGSTPDSALASPDPNASFIALNPKVTDRKRTLDFWAKTIKSKMPLSLPDLPKHPAKSLADLRKEPQILVDRQGRQVPEGINFSGISQAGIIEYWGSTGPAVCSGAVIETPGKSLVVSAAHCFQDPRMDYLFFAPGFHGLGAQSRYPYGVWTLAKPRIYIDRRYDGGAKYDIAIFEMARLEGKTLGQVTGMLKVDYNPPLSLSEVALIGYPWYESGEETAAQRGQPRACINNTTSAVEDQFEYMTITCTGMVSGVSGGPWVREEHGVLHLVALTGGAEGGGGQTEWQSAGTVFTDDTARLLAAIEAGETAQRSVLSGEDEG